MAEYGDFRIDEVDGLVTFLRNIEWQDPWIVGLIIFHITVTLTTVLTRNHGNFQVALFLILLLLVYFSESINELASNYWNLFSRQQYFDSKGMFISLVFSAPILLNCMVLVLALCLLGTNFYFILTGFIHESLISLCSYILQKKLFSFLMSIESNQFDGDELYMIPNHLIDNGSIFKASWLYQSSQLMTKLKRAQLEAQYMKQSKSQNSEKRTEKRNIPFTSAEVINRLRHKSENSSCDGDASKSKSLDATGIECT